MVSWVALVVDSVALRWALVLGTFAAYAWASVGMLKWVSDFLVEAPAGAPCRKLRVSSVLMLVVLFGLYGVVYLLAIAEVIDTHVELLAYSCMGFGCKVVLSMIFTAIRVIEHQHTLMGLLCRISGVSTAFMSLLRGSFDFVVPCIADESGSCEFPATHSGDSMQLERCLCRPLLNSSINELLAGDGERARFANYVQNAVRQADSLQRSHCFGGKAWQVIAGCNPGQMPPVAQVLHIKLERASVCCMEPGAPGDGCTDRGPLGAQVHLSVVPQSGLFAAGAGGRHHMVLALKLDQEERSGPPPLHVEDSLLAGPKESCRKENKEHPRRVGGTVGGLRARRLGKPAQEVARKREVSGKYAGTPVMGEACGDEAATQASEDAQSAGSVEWGLQAPFGGGWDACSQSSRLSCVGSVTAACRQLLGPLHDHLPPKQLVSKRVEDHVLCAAEMVRLRANAKIKALHHEKQIEEWTALQESYMLGAVLSRSRAPENGMDEAVWRSELLPHLQGPPPGRKPQQSDVPDDEELWYQAWQHTYESEDGSSIEGSEDAFPLPRTTERLTARTDPRMREAGPR